MCIFKILFNNVWLTGNITLACSESAQKRTCCIIRKMFTVILGCCNYNKLLHIKKLNVEHNLKIKCIFLFIITGFFKIYFKPKQIYNNIYIIVISIHYKKSSMLEDRVVSVSSAEDMEPG